jgi:hypothetical protein
MSIMPQGEDLRKAVKWISEEREADPEATLSKLVGQAGTKFDLSPIDCEFLSRFFKEEK